MIRFRALFALLLAIVIAPQYALGAAPPTAIVVVFPLTVNGDAEKDAGSKLAVLFAQQISENGVTVRPAPPGTERKNFLDVARALGAEYYITGFVTPLGNEVAVVEQVVSTASGTVIFSNSAQLTTYNDATGQGAILAQAVLRHANRGLGAIEPPPPRTSATPEPSRSNEANISGIFRRKGKQPPTSAPVASVASATTPGPVAPTPLPAPAAPSRATAPPTARIAAATSAPNTTPRATAVAVLTAPVSVAPASVAAVGSAIAVFAAGGSAPADRRAYAQRTLVAQLDRSGRGGTALTTDVSARELSNRAGELCATHLAKALVRADVATQAGDATYGQNTTALLDVTAVDCSGTVLLQQRFENNATGRRDWQLAIDRATAQAVTALARAIR